MSLMVPVRPGLRRLPRWLHCAGVLLLVSAGATGCGGVVAVDVPAPPEEIRAACERLHPALPTTLAAKPTRAATPRSVLTAVWGDPPIALRCGVPRPAAYTPTTEVIGVNGVEWFPERQADGYVFTTVGRVADVQVRVPAAYAPEVNPLTELAGPIAAAIPAVRR